MPREYGDPYYTERPAPVLGGLRSAFGLVLLAAALCFAVITTAAAIPNGHASVNKYLEVIVELFPFGQLLYWAVSEALPGILHVGHGAWAFKGTSMSMLTLTASVVLGELVKCIVTVAIFGTLQLARDALFGTRQTGRAISATWRVLFCLVSAIAASFLAPLTIRGIRSSIDNANAWLAEAAPTHLPVLSADVGAIAIGIIVAIIIVRVAFFMLARFIIIGAVRLLVAHAIVMILLVGLEYLPWAPSPETYVRLGIAVFVLCVVEASLDQ